MSGKLALITIGQAPRVDVLADVQPLLRGHDWAEHGALDQVTAEQLAALLPQPGEMPLVSRLRDGTRVLLAHARLLPLIEDAVERAARTGATAALLMCTGQVAPPRTSIPVYAAEQLVRQELAHTASGFGVITPVAAQLADTKARWERLARAAVPVAAADPYTGDATALHTAARELVSAGATSIVLDCFGYSAAMAQTVHRVSALPVHLTRLVATRAALRALARAG